MALLCPFETEVAKNCVNGKKCVFPLTSPLRTQAHVHTRSYQKLDRNPVNMKMLKSLNLKWLQKTKGCQIALKNSIPLLCIFRGFYIPLRACVCVCECGRGDRDREISFCLLLKPQTPEEQFEPRRGKLTAETFSKIMLM